MNPAEFRQEAFNAFDARDRTKLELAIRALTDPDWPKMPRERLELHRNFLHTQLAAVNEHLGRHVRLRRNELVAKGRAYDEAMGRGGSIDPSDPAPL